MVSIITSTVRPLYMDNLFQNYQHQLCEDKELIIVLNRDDMDIYKWKEKAKVYPNVFVYQMPGHTTLGECLNFAIEKSNHSIIAKFDDDDYYAPHYLTQAIQAMKETGAHVVGKAAYFVYFEENKNLYMRRNTQLQNTFTSSLAGSTLMFQKEIFNNNVKFPSMNAGEDREFRRMCIKNKCKMYSTDSYHYAYIRRSDVNSHTWKIDKNKFLNSYELVTVTDSYKPFVTNKIV